MIDFHSHFLPKIDDGSKSCEMSVEMLKASADYGIKTMVATPHFYIKTRLNALNKNAPKPMKNC